MEYLQYMTIFIRTLAPIRPNTTYIGPTRFWKFEFYIRT
jgi:hypothetical protein